MAFAACENRKTSSCPEFTSHRRAGPNPVSIGSRSGPPMLHAIDVNLALGNLVELVKSEAAAYR
jgi:hypothetical protein